MKIFAIFGLLATIALAAPAFADYYRYTDRHGNAIYTDNVNKIPADRRSTAKRYASDSPDQPPRSLDTLSKEARTVKPDDEIQKRLKERNQLQAIQKELEQELSSLIEENARLKEEQKSAVTPEEVKTINKKAVSFNTRYKAYQEKKAAYETRLDAFNKSRNTN